MPEQFKTTFLEILQHVESLQDFLNPEILGQIAQERDSNRRILEENEELARKVEEMELSVLHKSSESPEGHHRNQSAGIIAPEDL